MANDKRIQQVSLGCSTLILIALIVLVFSRQGTGPLEREVHELKSEVSELKESVEAQTKEIKLLRQNQQVMAGADVPEDRRAFSSTDLWYSPPPANLEFTPIDKERFFPVANSFQAQAQAALAELPARRLSAEEAARLTGKQLRAGGEAILLRAVVLNEQTGAFDVGVNGRTVHVQHNCLGRHPVPMTRKALVAVLPAEPKVVYVSCGMDE